MHSFSPYSAGLFKQKSPPKRKACFGAQDEIRTRTPLQALPPQSSVSTSSTTWAGAAKVGDRPELTKFIDRRKG